MNKSGRNDPCPCGSNKKFKKCCGMAKKPKIQSASIVSGAGSSKMFSLFQNNVKSEAQETTTSIASKISKPSGMISN